MIENLQINKELIDKILKEAKEDKILKKYYKFNKREKRMREAKTMTAVEIIKEMAKLEQDIDLKQLKIEKLKLEIMALQEEVSTLLSKHELLRMEIINRFPGLEKSPEFKKKC